MRRCCCTTAPARVTTGSGSPCRASPATATPIGARLSWSVGGTVTRRLKTGGGSYLSAHDPREILGLGPATVVEWIEIAWPAPSTRVDRLTNVKIDAYQQGGRGEGDRVDESRA